jgi:hypothetical protein
VKKARCVKNTFIGKNLEEIARSPSGSTILDQTSFSLFPSKIFKASVSEKGSLGVKSTSIGETSKKSHAGAP